VHAGMRSIVDGGSARRVSGQMMKAAPCLLFGALFLLGCASSSVETRKQERYGAYSALPAETRSLVDHGQIKLGMNMDAVYVAWGKPSQILGGESAQGATTTWVYHGSYLEEHRYWSHRYAYYGHCYPTGPYLDYDYYSRSYVKAVVVFDDHGVVKEWRHLPQPSGYSGY
jgi:hypothetical protein